MYSSLTDVQRIWLGHMLRLDRGVKDSHDKLNRTAMKVFGRRAKAPR